MNRHLVKRKLLRTIPGDQRMRFRDVHLMYRPKPASKVIQFYTSNPNIGNYLPVAGIRMMAGIEPDAWCIHTAVNWQYVNKNYKAAIIGGAGLFHHSFDQFWRECAANCRIPLILWGLGVCIPDRDERRGADRNAVREVAARAEVVNVRDDLTADYYGLDNVDISACPTVAYLNGMSSSGHRIAIALHDGLATTSDHHTILRSLEAYDTATTMNVQTRRFGVNDIIHNVYCTAEAVITTRLHGAIIGYALGLPYVALARDEKVRAFNRTYGGGVVVENPQDVRDALSDAPNMVVPDAASVMSFGKIASVALKTAEPSSQRDA